jgi:hypothetical protein
MKNQKHWIHFTAIILFIFNALLSPMTSHVPTTDVHSSSPRAETEAAAYYLYPYNLHLTPGTTSTIPIRVIDDIGNTISGVMNFYGYNAGLISISTDGYVTALRGEGSAEIGTWVSATIDGKVVNSKTIIRVLSTSYSIPFSQLASQHTVLYYPTNIAMEDLTLIVNQYQMSTVDEYAYTIQSQLMGLQPFAGAKQIYEIDFGENETQRVCGISGNPIRLGWNVAGNSWQNCFLVPFIAPRSPQWNVMFHEMGHNFTWASQAFGWGLGRFEYSEGMATAISMATLKTVLADPSLYPISTDTNNSLSGQLTMVTNTMSTNFQSWLDAGADFSGLNPDIVDGIWLKYQSERPDDFTRSFFRPLQPEYSSWVLPILDNLSSTDQHTIFAALISAARGQELSQIFMNTYHFPINSSLFIQAYAMFTQIMDGEIQFIYLPLIIK